MENGECKMYNDLRWKIESPEKRPSGQAGNGKAETGNRKPRKNAFGAGRKLETGIEKKACHLERTE